MSEQRLRQIISKKLAGYKRQEANDGRQEFDYILQLKEQQIN